MSWMANPQQQQHHSMESQMLRIKCILGDDIRIIKVNDNITYEGLLEQLAEDFQQAVVVSQYEDYEGDKVTVRGKSDLMEAITMCKELRAINPTKIITIKFFLKFQYNSSHSNNSSTSNLNTSNPSNTINSSVNGIGSSGSGSFYSNTNNNNTSSNIGSESGQVPRRGSKAPPLRTPPPSPPKSSGSYISNYSPSSHSNNQFSLHHQHHFDFFNSLNSTLTNNSNQSNITPPLRTPPGSPPKYSSPLISINNSGINSPPPLRTPPPSPPPSSPVNNYFNLNSFEKEDPFDQDFNINNNNSNLNNQQQQQHQQQNVRKNSLRNNVINSNNNNNNNNDFGGINLPRPSSPFQFQQQGSGQQNSSPKQTEMQKGFTDFPTLILNEHEELNTTQFKWQKGQILGRGGYGAVYLGLNNETGELFAVKQLEILDGSTMDSKFKNMLLSFSKEIEVMRSLKHENIVRYLGTCFDQTHLNVFLEYIPGGSISSLLNKFGAFSENVIKVYTKQILHGLAYLHSHQIIHRDIKGANILIDTKGIVKLSDFGCSKSFSGIVSQFKSMQGTPYWMAPEVIKQTGHGRSSDIWSLGCVIVEMATGQPPWSNITELAAVMYHIASSNSTPKLPDALSPEAVDFLSLCFKRDPKERPDANQLLRHPFITSDGDMHPSSHELSILIPSAPRYRFSSNPTPIRLPTPSVLSLPRALLINVFKFLPIRGLVLSVGVVCKDWHAIITDDDEIWRKHCLERSIIRAKDPNQGSTWRSTVIAHRRAEKLWFESKVTQTSLKGHSKCVYSIKLVDHSYVLSGGDDKKVKVWDAKKHKKLFSLKGHNASVKSIDYQADFSRIFTASADFSAKIWSTKTKKTVRTYSGHHEAVTCINYLGDVEGKVLTSSLDKTMMIWDAETGSTLSTLSGHTSGIYSVRFDSLRGLSHTVVSASADWSSRVWDTRTSKSVRVFKGHDDDVTCVHIYDGKVATGSGDGTIKLWDLGTGKIISTFIPRETQEKLWVWCCQFDNTKLVSSGVGGVIRIWDLNNERPCRTIGGHHETIFSLHYKENKLVTGSKDKLIKLWDIGGTGSSGGMNTSSNNLNEFYQTQSYTIDQKANNPHPHHHQSIVSRTSSFIKNI